ncbi:MAG: N-acetylmuramoyl-L-alanine amidase [Desulfobacterales bacterium]|nr:N-acetylmuramoyl-L-alanine amidase [Desulfobacterales bacterium]
MNPVLAGPTGVPEKTVNLAISKKLEKNLKSAGAKEVIMTKKNR